MDDDYYDIQTEEYIASVRADHELTMEKRRDEARDADEAEREEQTAKEGDPSGDKDNG